MIYSEQKDVFEKPNFNMTFNTGGKTQVPNTIRTHDSQEEITEDRAFDFYDGKGAFHSWKLTSREDIDFLSNWNKKSL